MNPVIARYAQGTFGHEITLGRHRLLSDVPTAQGGEDAGPSPHELLAASLASCTAITLRMYARRKQWPLKDAQVEVTIDKEGAETKLIRRMEFVGKLTQAQRDRLVEIADHCPIHRMLEGRVLIEDVLLPGEPQPSERA